MAEAPRELPDAGRGLRVPRKAGAKQAEDAEAAKPTLKKRLVMYGTWVVLLVLCGLAFAEFRAQSQFKKHQRICLDAIGTRTATGEASSVKLDDIRGQFSVEPVHSSGTHSFSPAEIYTWDWQGLRHYQLRLYTHPKDGTVWAVTTGSETD